MLSFLEVSFGFLVVFRVCRRLGSGLDREFCKLEELENGEFMVVVIVRRSKRERCEEDRVLVE